MAQAALQAGRQPGDVRLIGVTKHVPQPCVEAAIAAGLRCFGENTLQGARGRQAMQDDPLNEWHFIGHLQSNKAKSIPAQFHWLHTLDSLKLAQRLSASALVAGTQLQVLLQVNIARDPDKYGLNADPDSIFAFIESLLCAGHPGIALRGLMTIGRRRATPDETRATFAALYALAEDCARRFDRRHFTELSMGMSSDYELAIAEGATMIRVGSALFGPRQ